MIFFFNLIGHELPYSIKMSQLRDSYQSKNGDVTLPSNEEILEFNSTSNVEFILKHRKSTKKTNLGKKNIHNWTIILSSCNEHALNEFLAYLFIVIVVL